MSTDQTPTLTAAQAVTMVKERVQQYGGVTAASTIWECTPQMVHMVQKGSRRPTPKMLEDLQLEEIPAEVSYRRKGTSK